MSAPIGGMADTWGGVPAPGLEAAASGEPYTAGWSVAAIAVHSVLQIPVPIVLRLLVPGRDAITIDFRHHAFEWAHSMRDFPEAPHQVGVETIPVDAAAPAPFILPGQNLDVLLWSIGLHSFADRSASWLRPGERYHLVRWPNLTTMRHTVDHMRLTALLGNGWFTVTELATAAGVPEGQASGIVNALSLMGVLETAPVVQAAPAVVAAPARGGLVQRLRARLGF